MATVPLFEKMTHFVANWSEKRSLPRGVLVFWAARSARYPTPSGGAASVVWFHRLTGLSP
jgi:hypothetical protein